MSCASERLFRPILSRMLTEMRGSDHALRLEVYTCGPGKPIEPLVPLAPFLPGVPARPGDPFSARSPLNESVSP